MTANPHPGTGRPTELARAYAHASNEGIAPMPVTW